MNIFQKLSSIERRIIKIEKILEYLTKDDNDNEDVSPDDDFNITDPKHLNRTDIKPEVLK